MAASTPNATPFKGNPRTAFALSLALGLGIGFTLAQCQQPGRQDSSPEVTRPTPEPSATSAPVTVADAAARSGLAVPGAADERSGPRSHADSVRQAEARGRHSEPEGHARSVALGRGAGDAPAAAAQASAGSAPGGPSGESRQ